MTPVSAYIARPLADGLRNPAVCQENSIRSIIPLKLLDCRTAIKLALERIKLQTVESHWTDAGAMPPDEWSTAVIRTGLAVLFMKIDEKLLLLRLRMISGNL